MWSWRAEAHLDGKYLLRSCDSELSAEDMACGYRQLLEPGRGTGSNGRWTWCSQVRRAAGRVFATMLRSPEETIA
ncbi:hypothetical protein GCM10023080_057970 [Streptomyces pseudoechinosporeus]